MNVIMHVEQLACDSVLPSARNAPQMGQWDRGIMYHDFGFVQRDPLKFRALINSGNSS